MVVKKTKKMKIVLIHGFNDISGGGDNIDKTQPLFEALGYEVEKDDADYGYFSLWMVRFKKHSAVLRIIGALKDADVVVTYSNGANYSMKALKLINRRIVVIHCSPALNAKAKFPEAVSYAWVFHIKSDWTVWLAKLIPFSPWGNMGAVGYKGDNPIVTNVDFTDIAKFHGGMFKDEVVEYTVQKIDELIRSKK